MTPSRRWLPEEQSCQEMCDDCFFARASDSDGFFLPQHKEERARGEIFQFRTPRPVGELNLFPRSDMCTRHVQIQFTIHHTTTTHLEEMQWCAPDSFPFEVHTQGDASLGSGSYGTVRTARCTFTQRTVAVKRVSLARRSVRETFDREVSALSTLPPHSNVVRLVTAVAVDDGGVARGRCGFIVLERVTGCNLDVLLKQRGGVGFCEDDVRCFVRQLASALAHCHAHRVTHHDVSLSNILLERGTDRVVLCDFGMAVTGDVSTVRSSRHLPVAVGTRRGSLSLTAKPIVSNSPSTFAVDRVSRVAAVHGTGSVVAKGSHVLGGHVVARRGGFHVAHVASAVPERFGRRFPRRHSGARGARRVRFLVSQFGRRARGVARRTSKRAGVRRDRSRRSRTSALPEHAVDGETIYFARVDEVDIDWRSGHPRAILVRARVCEIFHFSLCPANECFAKSTLRLSILTT